MVLEIPQKGVSVYFILKIGLKMKEPQMEKALDEACTAGTCQAVLAGLASPFQRSRGR